MKNKPLACTEKLQPTGLCMECAYFGYLTKPPVWSKVIGIYCVLRDERLDLKIEVSNETNDCMLSK